MLQKSCKLAQDRVALKALELDRTRAQLKSHTPTSTCSIMDWEPATFVTCSQGLNGPWITYQLAQQLRIAYTCCQMCRRRYIPIYSLHVFAGPIDTLKYCL
mmetsp:Transcript_10003/g.21346  ORF Transcript_10003/g.21346 Transcript_10003/m.21346 type:complete len:101 (-) Transcript_10003:223-525(-)